MRRVSEALTKPQAISASQRRIRDPRLLDVGSGTKSISAGTQLIITEVLFGSPFAKNEAEEPTVIASLRSHAGLPVKVARKTADQSFTNSTTLADSHRPVLRHWGE